MATECEPQNEQAECEPQNEQGTATVLGFRV